MAKSVEGAVDGRGVGSIRPWMLAAWRLLELVGIALAIGGRGANAWPGSGVCSAGDKGSWPSPSLSLSEALRRAGLDDGRCRGRRVAAWARLGWGRRRAEGSLGSGTGLRAAACGKQ